MSDNTLGDVTRRPGVHDHLGVEFVEVTPDRVVITFFAEMARKYGKNPNVIYELFNEPVNDSWPKVKEYSIELIKTIRALIRIMSSSVGSPIGIRIFIW